MSRASEITMYMIILQASIAFVAALDVFPTSQGVPVSNTAYTVQSLEAYNNAPQNASFWSESASILSTIWSGFTIGVTIVFSVVLIYIPLTQYFHVPAILSAFIQVGVAYVYITWYAQFQSGKGWKLYE